MNDYIEQLFVESLDKDKTQRNCLESLTLSLNSFETVEYAAMKNLLLGNASNFIAAVVEYINLQIYLRLLGIGIFLV